MNQIKVEYFRDGKPQTEILHGMRVGYRYDDPAPGRTTVWANGPTEERTLILNSAEVTVIDMTIESGR